MVNRQIILVGAVALACAGKALAVSYSTDLGQTYSGTNPESSQNPWLRATFEDVASGQVRLTMEALNLSANEFVGLWTFNLNPAYSPSSLTFTLAPIDPGQAGIDSINQTPSGQNYKAGPEKYFDLQFDFVNSAGTDRLTSGERMVYDITLAGGTLTAADFLFVNQQKSGSTLIDDSWFSAAHVQAIGASGQSGWVGATVVYENADPQIQTHGVPDRGPTIAILGVSFLGLLAYRRSLYRQDAA